jgi:hypothetical protein
MRLPGVMFAVVCLLVVEPRGWDTVACRADGPRKGDSSDERLAPRAALRMSQAVVCRSIDGYEAFEPLPDAALTSDEKLLVYYRPLGYQTVYESGFYHAHFTQDGEIHRRGQKAVLRQKKKLLEYKPKSSQPLALLYMRNTISLKGLAPGEYELIILLRDELAKAPPATQVVKFRVVPAIDPRENPASEPP